MAARRKRITADDHVGFAFQDILLEMNRRKTHDITQAPREHPNSPLRTLRKQLVEASHMLRKLKMVTDESPTSAARHS
eukprot:5783174-Amphidinium_carterae.1